MRKLTFVMALSLSLIAAGSARSVLVGLTSPSPQGNNAYKTYSNARFNYSISYPANLLIPQGESENGDGQVFRAKDGSAEMRVYGRYNVNHETLRSSFSEASREWADGVTYKVIRPDWFVVTALVNRKVHYQKTMLRRGVFKTFLIEYDESRQATFDPVTARVARSFVG